MITVVLYGRNDSYGYNLHKRAVLSLNCIAEVLDDPDDEIIFVDYNSPDDLPTFVDAISDTLTARARTITRVLRVRQRLHQRFASRTHLKALESPSRNAAIRRSNPNNRWILSTNTDMLFIPRSSASLSAALAKLPDGFYHTARFELPEILWETLDRSDPRSCLDKVAAWGTRLQLQEVVYGTPTTLFDGPGDFQLILRSDAFEIFGFDERMLLGWHVDSNIAKRLNLLRSEPVKSALGQVLAFHCDHNREITPAHAHGAVQNDWGKFVTDVTTPQIEEQRETWGFADEELEDQRAGESRIESILEELVPAMPRPFYVTSIQPQLYQDMRYDPQHAIPYVANVIGALPRNWNVAYAGCRRPMFELFVRTWKALGFTGKILINEQVAQLVLRVTPGDGVEIVGEQRAHEEANLFVFEMGETEHDLSDQPTGARDTAEEGMKPLSHDDHVKVILVHRTYVRAVAAEREHSGDRRRFVLINMQNNPADATVDSRIGASWTPVSTHVRHGFVLPDPFAEVQIDPAAWLEKHLRGSWKPNRHTLLEIIGKIRAAAPPSDFDEYTENSGELIRLLSTAGAAEVLDVPNGRLETLLAALDERRPSVYARRRRNLAVIEAATGRRSLSRMIGVEDFDDPDWGRVAVRVVGVGPFHNTNARGRNAWESSHIVYVLEKLGLTNVTMLLQHPKDPQSSAQSLAGAVIDWSANSAVFDASTQVPGNPAYDAVVISPATVTMAGARHVPAIMAAADAALKVGGACIMVCDVLLDGAEEDSIDLRVLESGVFDETLARETGWRLRGPLELGISASTFDTAWKGAQRPVDSAVRYDYRGNLRASCIVVFEKVAVTEAGAWNNFYALFLGDKVTVAQ